MKRVKQILKGKLFTGEWSAVIFIVVLVGVLQFFVVRTVLLKDKYIITRELYRSVRWQVEDWNHRKSMEPDGKIRGVSYHDGGRELLLNIDSSSYSFKLDTKKSMEDIYLRIACDLNISQPMTLQILDSVLRLNSNDHFGKQVIAFQRVDSTGRVLESFPKGEHSFKNMNKAGRIKLGFISGDSIDVFYLLSKEFWWRYMGLIVGIFLAGVSVAGLAITYIFAYQQQREKRKYQIKWMGDDLHSLKTPVKQLNGIMQWFELKCSEPENGERKAERAYTCLNEILQNMDECILTCSILHKTKLKFADVNLKTLLLDLIHQQREAHQGEKAPKIELDYQLPDHVVYSSVECLTLIVRNLLDNAVKYSKDEIRVWVRTFQVSNKMVIEVEDHGIGISDKDQKVIFNEYYRVEGTGKDGNGRGLPCVIEIVEKMRGKIEVKSELGKGSCFKILIPIWKKKNEK